MALFRRYRLVVQIGRDVARSSSLQAALLTAVNTGRRCFLGGVEVVAAAEVLEAPLRIVWSGSRTIGDAIVDLQGVPVVIGTPEVPRIVIGDVAPDSARGAFAVRATLDGWSAGVVPLSSSVRLPERQECTPAGVLAGALAISEAFQYVRGDTVEAGAREIGLSLWDPEPSVDWRSAGGGPQLELLPSRLWLIGLGHLGQAYLWTLGLLPYADPSAIELVLQDFDALVEANDSTSPLTHRGVLGQKKTRAMAAWAEHRGFRTVIQERRFAHSFRVSDAEPQLALCGVDNPLARADLEDVGFARVIEAGLGKGTREYLAFQIHTFPSSGRSAKARWSGMHEATFLERTMLAQPAYRSLATQGLDDCGITTLAGRSVGASFVGAATSALVIAEALRITLAERTYTVIDATLRAPDRRRAIVNEVAVDPFNPGITRAELHSMA
ncbi:MAG TPA: hypothetical protein VFW98_00365 [Gemmatimonadaceae bacterium]|nr:hypothetical protein [Gemmatimonadaceae bacterium]